MSVLVAVLAGAGVLLVASPFLWPVRSREAPRVRLARVHDLLARAGLARASASGFLVVSALAGLAAGAGALAVLPVAALDGAIALVVAALPWAALSWRARARRRAHRVVWPDLVDHLVSGIRAGLSLPEAVSALAGVGPASTRAAFAAFARDYATSARFSPCLDELKAALADPVADRIVETLRMAREVGGTELPLVLRSLAAYVREQEAVRAELEARQSWVVNAARLGVTAPWVVLGLLASRPEAAAAYNSPLGSVVVGGGIAITVLAYRLMMLLGRLPEEGRWFR